MLRPALLAALVAFSAPALAGGVLLTNEDGYTGRGLDLSDFRKEDPDFSFGSIAVDGFIFTAAPGSADTSLYEPELYEIFPYFFEPGGRTGIGAFVGQDIEHGYSLGLNGLLGGDTTLLGLDSFLGSMQLLGDTGYEQLGFQMNYFVPEFGTTATIWTLDQNGDVIDEFNLSELAPISTPDSFNQFAFRGVAYDDGTLIYGMRFGGSFMAITDTDAGTPPAPPVAGIPEPASWALMIAGFGLVGAAIRRRRASASEAA